MATLNSRDYAPYFRNGLLLLPEKTVDLLISAGLDDAVGKAALKGLNLVDDREEIAIISKSLEGALEKLETSSDEYHVLNSDETSFMLTGKGKNKPSS